MVWIISVYFEEMFAIVTLSCQNGNKQKILIKVIRKWIWLSPQCLLVHCLLHVDPVYNPVIHRLFCFGSGGNGVDLLWICVVSMVSFYSSRDVPHAK